MKGRFSFIVFSCFSVVCFLTASCVTLSDVTLIQDKGNTVLDSGYIVYHKERYEVRPHDLLTIHVSSLYPTLDRNISSVFRKNNSSYPVGEEGHLDLPLLGKLYVLRKSLEEVKVLILDALSLHFQRDKLFVRVLMGGTYSVVGEMNQTFPVGTVRPVNILEAFSLIGKISSYADLKHIELIRQGVKGAKIYVVDVTDRSLMNKPYFWLQPKDIIHVKPTVQRVAGFGATGYNLVTTITGTITTLTGLVTTYLYFEDRFKAR